jgi:NAD(P)-dependent dehydrogenase (short-subunit alcohol dehydrogenase family)
MATAAKQPGQLMPFRDDLLAGEAVIVTGGGTGLGRGIALALAAVGAKVVVSSRKLENIAAVADTITASGGIAKAIVCNVRDHDAVEAMVAAAEDALGPVRLLVNNAGATFTVPAEDLTDNGLRAVIETDIFGTFYCCQALGRRLIKRGDGGSIVNITSTSPNTGNPGRIHGGAGKAGVESITKSLAVEWGPHQIRVNAVAPGYVPTDGVDKATLASDDAIRAARAATVPLGRVGRVEDIAWPTVFLLSDAASYINGATLVADGGRWLSSGRGKE